MLKLLKDAQRECEMCELGRGKVKIEDTDVEADPHIFSNINREENLPEVMVVGQLPGPREIMQRSPLAWDSFDIELEKHKLERKHFYITNAIKCYASNPSNNHIEVCSPWLDMEIAVIKPKMVVAVGPMALEALCPGVQLSDAVGKITISKKYNVKVFTIYIDLDDPMHQNQFERDMGLICGVVWRLIAPF